jgi:tRNA A-37 threonylcarbamoyl transferase component Bud32
MTFIATGVDAKILTYDENAKEHCTNKINFVETMNNVFGEQKYNCFLINLRKDTKRYELAVKEFKKISIEKFNHLIATYWKERDNFVSDLNFVANFLLKYQGKEEKNIEIDIFSDVKDDNIYIQDGPLACYVSHLRCMIHSYLENGFDSYTIIAEDDIHITNTENMIKYLDTIDKDWDVILFGSSPKILLYDKICYRHENEFHSTHFYVIKNKSFDFLFKNLYPITDQVDVLISNLYKKMKLYNVVDCVYQRNMQSNTQNNLHTILNSPHYYVVRKQIDYAKNIIKKLLEEKMPNNIHNKNILNTIIFDTLYLHLYLDKSLINNISNEDNEDIYIEKLKNHDYNFSQLYECILFIVSCAIKGKSIYELAYNLTYTIIYETINNFEEENSERGYNYGSTCYTYIKDDVIVKKYTDDLRWKIKNHDNSKEIFNKELFFYCNNKLEIMPNLLNYNLKKKILYLTYEGESLYLNFNLPKDWEKQIENIFDILTKNNIYYNEFNLKNILVKNNIIKFVDFGLAEVKENCDNSSNCKIFIELLEQIQQKFSTLDTWENKIVAYSNMINNIKLHNIKKYISCVC